MINLKKGISMLCAAALFSMLPTENIIFAAEHQTGNAGDSITWELDGDTLYLTGTGTVPVSVKQRIDGKSGSFAPGNYDSFYNYTWKDVADSVKTLVIGEGITGISRQSFFLFPNLETVTLPDTLTVLGDTAFLGCPKLKTVQCTDSITEYGADIFLGDPEMYGPEKPFCILNDTLVAYGGEDEEQIVIPEEVHRLAPAVLSNCSWVREITLPSALTEIGVSAFSSCSSLTEIRIPETVTKIGFGAFAQCTSLESVTLPPELTEVESFVFAFCTNLKEVTIPDSVQTIGIQAFVQCLGLTEVAIPDSVLSIQTRAFGGCKVLKNVSGCKGLEQIGEMAFYGCNDLEDIELPDTIRYIEPTAFQEANYLKQLHRTEDAVIIGNVLVSASPKSKFWQIPDGVVTVVNHVLNNTDLFEVVCPDSLRYLCADALSGNLKLMNLRLNEGCVSIGENALSGCRSLHTLVIPSTVSVIEPQGNHSLTDLYGTPGSAAEQFAKENGIRFHSEAELALSDRDLTIDYAKDGWYFGNSADIFGGDYYLTDADRQRLESHGLSTQGVDKEWGGSCVGLALTVILMKNGAFSPADLQSGAQTLSDVQPTDAVRSFINYYQCTQGRDGTTTGMSDFQKIYNMSLRLPNVKHGESPFLLCFDCAGGGSHGVAAYGLESGEWTYGGRDYDRRILVWDSNFPDALHDDSCLYYDSLTLDFCIPAYGVHVAEGADDNTAGLVAARNDLNVLNAYPYQFAKDKPGDVNLDGIVDVSDAVLVARFAAEDSTAVITDQGRQNADVTHDGNVDGQDTTKILRYIAKQISLADLAA